MDDGYHLPLLHWGNPDESKGIVLALHGLNDYGSAFESTGHYLETRGISLISYDLRGFGTTAGAGYWHGSQRMIKDNLNMLQILRQRYPEKPLFMLGESMGGAIVLATLDQLNSEIDGTILLAPAIWSRQSMPWYQRFLLWLAVHTVPAKKLTGEGLDIQASDNIEMLRSLGRDPLVIKATRVDVLYGVTNLMDIAAEATVDFSDKSLIMYGKHDDIVPRQPTCRWLRSLPDTGLNQREILIYENGYHMLNRDLQAIRVLDDIAEWVLGIAEKNEENISTQKGHEKQKDIYISLLNFCGA
jgi:alpha-beta hydrolase superfamily lysophospholipase